MIENLNNWAYSFSGCDGGCPDAKIWLCGIEWGYEKATDKEREHYYKSILSKEIKNGHHELNTSYNFFSDESMSFPFHLAFSKLYSVIQNRDISDFKNNSGDILKLNLSPIAFRKDDEGLWNENLVKATGIKTKTEFVAHLKTLNRFTEITTKHKPKLIVCIGNGHRNNFISSFFGNEKIKLKYETIKPEISNKNQNNRYIYHAKHNDTLLVITPFSTSPNGLNSDYLLQSVGEIIKDLLT